MPVFEDLRSCQKIVFELNKLFSNKIRIILIDDGSIVDPVAKSFQNSDIENLIIITLYKNVGHQAALAIGIDVAEKKNLILGEHLVLMDSDGEDSPNAISYLLDVALANMNSIVVAERTKRSEGIFFKIFYWIYKRIFILLTGRVIDFGNFMVISKSHISRIIRIDTLSIHIAASVFLSRIPRVNVPTERSRRYYGSSKMNFVSLCLHGFKALSIFSEEVLVRVGLFCSTIAFIALTAVILIIGLKAAEITIPGWASLTVGILMLIFLQTGTITLMLLLNTKKKMGDIIFTPNYLEGAREIWISETRISKKL
jgi:hypothetical protein